MTQLSLGISPCPNDTFTFCAIAKRLIDLRGIDFHVYLHDVERLNRGCKELEYDISKISTAAYPHLQEHYALLYSGGALGRGCGPLIVARQNLDLAQITTARVAVPGLMTTAYLLVCLFAGQPLKVMPMRFDSIMPSVSRGECEFGVIIHEGRFTYHKYGLSLLLDLGQWWEEKTALPIPLGVIAIRKNLGQDLARKIDHLISESLALAWDSPQLTTDYVNEHAQEIESTVVKKHIDLYVNRYTRNMGEEGKNAILALLTMGAEIGILPKLHGSPMAYE